jgi:hypothetical protein
VATERRPSGQRGNPQRGPARESPAGSKRKLEGRSTPSTTSAEIEQTTKVEVTPAANSEELATSENGTTTNGAAVEHGT